jgi:DNA-binding CsgD family transcriptional regulator/tetratricopeptide (TPR) repeat protein
MHDLPGSLRPTTSFPFVGRSRELAALRADMPRAGGAGHQVVLVGGQPGSGKSRLVREFAGEASQQGVLVLYGACDAVVPTPYGPFVEAFDQLARAIEPEELRAAAGASGSELSRLSPDLAARIGDLTPPLKADPDTERHRLHTAVIDLLTGVSLRQPLMLVLEDAHWADTPTLLLLRHLARTAGGTPLLLLATFRDADADMSAGLADALADLRRSERVTRLRLEGLTREEVTDFVDRAGDGGAASGVSDVGGVISDLTEGNAFLVCELWRALVETGGLEVADGTIRLTRSQAELGTPESVREVVSQRLSRLAPLTTDLLELAATVGAEFEIDLIRRIANLDEAQLFAALDEAMRSGMIEEIPSRSLAYRFTHELVRRALYDRLTGVRRAELHLRVGEEMEGGEETSARVLADLAHHFAVAAPLGGLERAVEYNVRAARAASDALAFDEAADRLRAALELGIDDPARRAEAYLDLGFADHRGGKALDALQAFRSAGEIGQELGDAQLLSRAAIGYEEACWRPGFHDQGAVELLEAAATALGTERSTLRVGLLAGLARALDFQGNHERASAVRASAVAMARDDEDRSGLATLLMRAYWSRGAISMEEILDMLTEARDLGEELGNTEIRAEAMAWRTPAFVALSDMASARREVVALHETAERTAQPFMLHVAEHYGAAIALGDGRLGEAEAMVRRSNEWSRLLSGRDASGVFGIQMFSLRREQGRLDELAPAMKLLAGRDADDGPWRPGLAAMLAELGMEEEARRELERVRTEGLSPLRESLWLASLTYLTDACTAVGDEAMAAILYPELESLAGANVMIGHLVSWYGAADRYLGMLAATLGEPRLAGKHFEAALELNRRMGAETWVAHTSYEFARAIRGSAGDGERAEALLEEARELAGRIGMKGLLGRIDAVSSGPSTTELPDELSPREGQILRLVARGLSNREIGEDLFISEHTAANHIRSILRKTGCANRTEAASYAHRNGLADL